MSQSRSCRPRLSHGTCARQNRQFFGGVLEKTRIPATAAALTFGHYADSRCTEGGWGACDSAASDRRLLQIRSTATWLERLTGVRFTSDQNVDRYEQLSACCAFGDIAASSGLKRVRAHVRFFVLTENQHLRGGDIATDRAGHV